MAMRIASNALKKQSDGVVAAIECEIASEVDAGDHMFVLGRVLSLDILRPAAPLLFFKGRYGTFTAL